jgi:hypothetical protein
VKGLNATPIPVDGRKEEREKKKKEKKKKKKKKARPLAVEERLSEVRTTRLRCWNGSSG